LLADFLYEDRAPGDAYLLFKEMIKHNLSAHYVTERKDIYQEFNNINRESLQIIPIINKQYNITGNTLEKYLNLFLRLKVVISGAEFYSIYNIFYDIEYITFISIGHGVNFFKHFLFSEYYGCKRYNKIILPSNVIIKIAKKYGWNDKNILKVGLPKWDYLDKYKNEIKKLSNNRNLSYKYSIFIMFTWRELKKQENISPFYFNNIKNLLNNNELNNALKYNNITLYISLHHNLLDKQNVLSLNENIKYINQKDILECLAKSNLISDFSSVIFDFIYQKKPFIIYLPDSNDSNIKNIYTNEYYDIINGLKNDSIYFENKFFNIEDTVKKIIYYINNNFKIEKNLETFYNNFEFNDKNRINNLINYIENMK
jgi:CDP-glycerol glycerophosphotransferase (TagB/SpsB family)